MILNYYRYLLINLVKKKSLWISCVIFWLFLAVIFLIVPGILKLSPTSLWTNTLFDIKAFTIIFIAIISGLIVVLIFREPIDDGTEIIILSKPINRNKVVLIKLLSLITIITVTIFVSVIILCFSYCFGEYSYETNPGGVDNSKLTSIILSFIIGVYLISFIWSSLCIILSLFINKVGVLAIAIAASIVLDFFYLIIPYLFKPGADYVSDNYSVSLKSQNTLYLDATTQKTVHASHSNDAKGTNTLTYVDESNKHGTPEIIPYINVAQQLTNVYNIFDPNYEATVNESTYGSHTNVSYRVVNRENIYENVVGNHIPLFYVRFNKVDGVTQPYYRTLGFDLGNTELFSIIDSSLLYNTVFGYVPSSNNDIKNIYKSKFFSTTQLLIKNNEEFDDYLGVLSHYLINREWAISPAYAGYWWDNPYNQKWENRNYPDWYNQYTNDKYEANGWNSYDADFIEDMFYSPSSPIYQGKNLKYQIKENEQGVDQHLDFDFLQVWFNLFLYLGNKYYENLNIDINDNQLKPLQQWSDSTTYRKDEDQPMDIYEYLNPRTSDYDEDKVTYRRWESAKINKILYYITKEVEPFITSKPFDDDSKGMKLVPYWSNYQGTDTFRDTYIYTNHLIMNGVNSFVFWTLMSITLFGLSLFLYYRHDFS